MVTLKEPKKETESLVTVAKNNAKRTKKQLE